MAVAHGAGKGSLLLFANMAGPGLKELRFDYLLKTTGTANYLTVYYSQDGGATYTPLSTFGISGVNALWQPQVVAIPSTSATTVIKFEATGAGTSSSDFDMGIDNVRLFPTCSGTPNAGVVDSNGVCVGTGLTLSLNGTSGAGALSWIWQKSDGLGWDTIPGGNIEHPSVVLDGPTWYRCIVTCANTGLSNISAPRLISPLPFYRCNCASLSTTPNSRINIGNVKMFKNPAGAALIDAGSSSPVFLNITSNQHYTDRTNLSPADIYADSAYRVRLSFITTQGPPNNNSMPNAVSKIYIDWNQNGAFEASEKVMSHLKPAGLTYLTDSALVTVPHDAPAGITAMGIISNSVTDTSEAWGPCNTYSLGETEDYLVHVWRQVCTDGSVAGDVTISDTLSCPDYPFTLTNSNYDDTTGQLTRVWQQSINGISYTDIVGSQNQSVLVQHFTVPMWYRVQSICAQGGTTTTSNAVKINKNLACYCVSYADGGFAGMEDSSDIGGFSFGDINYPLVAGHLNNPDAVNGYTNHTIMTPTILWADSTYNYTIDHILIRDNHADAKVTMFLDYNANGVYDIPEERTYSDTSTIFYWMQSGFIVIPSDVTVDVPTGLRVIINNNMVPNVASDNACGVYTSGETEDYVVMFKKKIIPPPPSGINNMGGVIQSIHIFPNPATSMVSIYYKGQNINNAVLKVQSIAGAILEQKNTGKLRDGESMNVNLSHYAKGIYFISLEAEGSKVTGKVVLQ